MTWINRVFAEKYQRTSAGPASSVFYRLRTSISEFAHERSLAEANENHEKSSYVSYDRLIDGLFLNIAVVFSVTL